MPSVSLQGYATSREHLLDRIVAAISSDDRFVAAWLTGSYSRGTQDALSDIDITIAVSDEHSEILCRRLAQVSAQTTAERITLFSQFGEIAMLHENNHNAPGAGTFTNTIYSQSAVVVDWILVPQAQAQRPSASSLLFDRVGIPEAAPDMPESLEQRASKATEIVAFFWMMMAVAVKYIIRGDSVLVVTWLEELHKMLREIRRLLAGEPFLYQGGSLTVAVPDCGSQIEMIYKLAHEMEDLTPGIVALGGFVRPSPVPTLDVLLNLAREACNR